LDADEPVSGVSDGLRGDSLAARLVELVEVRKGENLIPAKATVAELLTDLVRLVRGAAHILMAA
jgi:hypothetical protein